jgi:anti-anti-sigma factor
MDGKLADIDFVVSDHDRVVAAVVGEIDGSNAGEVRRAVADNVPASARLLIVDLSETTYIDSAGVELIFELARRLAARRQAMGLVVPDGSGVRRVLELCDVASVARLDSTRAEAEDGRAA